MPSTSTDAAAAAAASRANGGGVGVGGKREREPEEGDAEAEARRAAQRKARDEKHSKRMKKLMQTDPAAAERMEYRRRVGLCCRDQDMAEALRLFAEIKARGIDIGPEGYNALLSLCGAQGETGLLLDVFDDMRARKVPLSEAAFVSVIRAKALGGAPEEAEGVMDEMLAAKQRPRLRCFSPLILGYAAQGKAGPAFAVYDRMLALAAAIDDRERATAALEPTETELAALLRVAGAAKDEALFLRALGDMQEVVLEPTAETWEAVEAWFTAASAPASEGGAEVTITKPTRVGSDGGCAACGARLASVDLSSEGSAALLAMVEEIVLQSEERREDWGRFKAWLEEAVARDAFDVVVDGANVGYFQMNYAGAPPHVNYGQIAGVVEHLYRQGKRPLLVLHARHVTERKVPPEFRALVEGWRAAGILCTVPYRNNDDWFWLCATVRRGGRTLVVTNDQMRDHHFQMLSRKTFLRWRERHQAPYTINTGSGVVQVEEPPVFSRCIQGPAAATEEDGEGGKVETRRWHLPLAESQEDWLCVVQRRRRKEEGEGGGE